ncbi:MAG: hypothetical protein EBZ13_09585 [Planctomycetia bacterium]|nr:hypothetical protein [Planctomycetia bacterium]
MRCCVARHFIDLGNVRTFCSEYDLRRSCIRYSRSGVTTSASRPAGCIACPHRSNTVLAGIVNVRGQLLLCGSLHGLLGLRQSAPAVPQLQPTSDGKGMPGTPNHEPLRTPGRLLVASHSEGRSTRRLAFAVDEVAGVQRIAMANLRDVPSTLGKPGQRYSTALFAWQSRRVSLLAADRLFTGIHEQIPQ